MANKITIKTNAGPIEVPTWTYIQTNGTGGGSGGNTTGIYLTTTEAAQTYASKTELNTALNTKVNANIDLSDVNGLSYLLNEAVKSKDSVLKKELAKAGFVTNIDPSEVDSDYVNDLFYLGYRTQQDNDNRYVQFSKSKAVNNSGAILNYLATINNNGDSVALKVTNNQTLQENELTLSSESLLWNGKSLALTENQVSNKVVFANCTSTITNFGPYIGLSVTNGSSTGTLELNSGAFKFNSSQVLTQSNFTEIMGEIGGTLPENVAVIIDLTSASIKSAQINEGDEE